MTASRIMARHVSRTIYLALGGLSILLLRPGKIGFFLVIGVLILNLVREKWFFRTYRFLNMAALVFFALILSPLVEKLIAFETPGTPAAVTRRIAVSILIFLLLWDFLLKRIQTSSSKWKHLLVPVIGVTLLLGNALLRFNEEATLIGSMVMLLSLRNMGHFIYAVLNSKKQATKINVLDSLNPFWNFAILPFTFRRKFEHSERDSLLTSGTLILAYALTLKFALDAITTFAPHSLVLQAILISGKDETLSFGDRVTFLNFYQSPIFSWSDRCVITLGSGAYHLLDLVVNSSVLVGAARLCGFPILRHVYRPLKSDNFYSFLSRCGYHYAWMIRRTLIYPMVRSMQWIQNKKLRISGVVFLSVSLFGIVYHFLLWPLIFLQKGTGVFLKFYAGYTLFFFILGLAVGASVFATLSGKNETRAIFWQRIKNFYYFLVYGVFFAMMGSDYFLISAKDHLQFTLSLFEFWK